MKKAQALLLLVLAIVAVGCGPRYVDFFPYHDDGTPKPRVALVPVIDKCSSLDSSTVAEQITCEIHYESMQSGNLYLISDDEVSRDLAQIGQVEFFGSDLSFTKKFSRVDYVILAEIIQHDAVPRQTVAPAGIPLASCPPEVVFKMRVRVIDVRCEPVVVLQEVLSYKCLATHERKTFSRQRMVKDFVSRMEEILCRQH